MIALYIVIGYFLSLYFVIGFFEAHDDSIRGFTDGWPHWAIILFYLVAVPIAIPFTIIFLILNGIDESLNNDRQDF